MHAAVDVAELLAPWRLTAPTFLEIDHGGRRSRAWWVESSEGSFVAKLTFDRACYVTPGLRVAAAVAAAGLATGPPVLTARGELAVEVEVDGEGDSDSDRDRITERRSTLALLTAVPGDPLVPNRPGAAEIAGDLLGRVHAILAARSRRDWVPADLLEWLEAFAASTGNRAAASVLSTLTERRHPVRSSVLYGDPSPEILVADGGAVGLIDWGTPSWGPQLHDVAVWLRWLGETPGSRSGREGPFLDAYRSHVPLSGTELRLLPEFGRYAEAFGWGRSPS